MGLQSGQSSFERNALLRGLTTFERPKTEIERASERAARVTGQRRRASGLRVAPKLRRRRRRRLKPARPRCGSLDNTRNWSPSARGCGGRNLMRQRNLSMRAKAARNTMPIEFGQILLLAARRAARPALAYRARSIESRVRALVARGRPLAGRRAAAKARRGGGEEEEEEEGKLVALAHRPTRPASSIGAPTWAGRIRARRLRCALGRPASAHRASGRAAEQTLSAQNRSAGRPTF